MGIRRSWLIAAVALAAALVVIVVTTAVGLTRSRVAGAASADREGLSSANTSTRVVVPPYSDVPLSGPSLQPYPTTSSGGHPSTSPGGPSHPTTSSPPTSPTTTRTPVTTTPSTTTPSTSSSTTAPATSSTADTVPRKYRHPMGWYGDGKVVALTFDDGPGPWTGQVLDVLDRHGIKATFCQIGSQVGDYPAIERRIVADGHTLCNHSFSHDEKLADKPEAEMVSQITRTQNAIRDITGVAPSYYRAPAGNFGSDGKLPGVLAKYHLLPLAWAVDSWDWRKPGVDKIVDNVMGSVDHGAIILMHDGGGDRSQTLAALPKIIAKLQAAGYTFIALPA